MNGPILQFTGVTKRYGDGPTVLDALTWTVATGDCLAVTGPSGCGKSTLLNLAGLLDRPDLGSVHVAGHDVASLDDRAAAAVRARTVGFVFQEHHLLPQLSARENVLVPTLARGVDRAGAEDRADALLDRTGLAGLGDRRPDELSGGQRQRIAIVRALVNRPALLLVDEPTGALDAATAEKVIDLLVALNAEHGVTLVMVTHADRLAARMNRVLRLEAGRLTELP